MMDYQDKYKEGLIYLFILNLIDFVQTIFALTYLEAKELNPLINILSDHIGLYWTLFILKIIGVNYVIYSCYVYSYKVRMSHIIFVAVALIGYLFVVMSNFYMIYYKIANGYY